MTHIGYLAPDGTHHPCAALEHRECAKRVCESWLGVFGVDAEEELDRRGYVRIERDDSDDGAIQWAARYYDEAARITREQRAWLGARGYGRLLRDVIALWTPPGAIIEPEAQP